MENYIVDKKNYAICMWGQLRSVNTTINNLYDNLIKALDADLYLLVQKTKKDIDNDINLFNDNVITKIIYDPPEDITKLYNNYDKLEKRNNYIYIPCLQVFYNWYKIYETFGDIFEKNYRYIIMTRSDFLHLFPFPEILKLHNNDDIFWCYDGHEWGGVNTTLICIPSKYIKKYLSLCYEYLQDSNNIKRFNALDINAESFQQIIFNDNNWKIGKMQNNAFITATNKNEITTWGGIHYCEKNKVYFKYIEQLKNSYYSLNEYEKNKKTWKYNGDNKIILQ